MVQYCVDVYDGAFSYGEKTGIGIITWVDGSNYQGNLVNGV